MPALGNNLISTLATSLMIKNVSATAGNNFINIVWVLSNFLPMSYKVELICWLMFSGEKYRNKTYTVSQLHTSLFIEDLLQRSQCVYTLFAIYNPASIDEGITKTVYTVTAGKGAYILVYDV